MNYAVTGGAGFIGSHLIDRLLSLGHHVVCIDNLFSGKEENIAQHYNNPHFKFYRRDICDDLSDIFEKESFNGVFHFAALISVQYSMQHPDETHHVNVDGTINLLTACKTFNVPRFIFASSCGIYGDQDVEELHEKLEPNALSPYALHKLVSEHYCRLYHLLYNLETVSFRNFNVYGPRQDPYSGYAGVIPLFIDRIHKGEPPIINGDGEQTRDFIYISDIIDAFTSAGLTTNKACFGQVFNLGTGVRTSVNEIYQHVSLLSSNAVKPVYGPSVVEPRHFQAHIGKAREFLQWEPKVQFSQGLALTHARLIEVRSREEASSVVV